MFRTKLALALLAATSASVIAASSARANVIYDYDFHIASISATSHATIDLQPGHITVTLTNLDVDSKSVGENISGFWFTLHNPITSASLESSTGIERVVAGNGAYSVGNQVSTGWAFSTSGGTVTLSGLGAGSVGPMHTIIGAPDANGIYESAKGSIAGNGPHNPFLALSAVFEIDMPGLTSDFIVDSAQMRFGTSPGSSIFTPTHVTTTTTTTPIPEPASFALFGLGILLISKRRQTR